MVGEKTTNNILICFKKKIRIFVEMKKNKFLSGRLDLVLHSHRLTKVGMGNHIIQNLSNTLSKNISLLIKSIFLSYTY